jgi:hypothetical protein
VFSNGIVILALLAIALIWAFDGSTTRLIQLYIIGVFVSFTLSQAGMVRHWWDLLRWQVTVKDRRRLQRAMSVNALGAVTTALVLLIVLVTKFAHGAWIVVIAMPVVFGLMSGIRRHYDAVNAELQPVQGGVVLPSRVHAIVLVSKLQTPALRAIAFARAARPSTLVGVTVATNEHETDELTRAWNELDIPLPLTVLHSPFRDITRPVLEDIAGIRRESPRDVVAVYIPEYVVGHWWENLLHNHSALRLKARLLFVPNVMGSMCPSSSAPPRRAHAPHPVPRLRRVRARRHLDQEPRRRRAHVGARQSVWRRSCSADSVALSFTSCAA